MDALGLAVKARCGSEWFVAALNGVYLCGSKGSLRFVA